LVKRVYFGFKQQNRPLAKADLQQLKGVTEYAVTTVKSVGFFQDPKDLTIFEKAPGKVGGRMAY